MAVAVAAAVAGSSSSRNGQSTLVQELQYNVGGPCLMRLRLDWQNA